LRDWRNFLKLFFLFGVFISISTVLFINLAGIQRDYLFGRILDDSHLFLFVFLGGLILKLVNLKTSDASLWPARNYVYSTVLGLTVSVCYELIQPFFARSLEIADIFLNVMGIFFVNGVFYLWACKTNQKWTNLKRIFFRTSFIIIYTFMLASIFNAWGHHIYNLHQSQQQFPILASFEDDWELYRWDVCDSAGIKIVPEHAKHGRFSLRFKTKAFTTYPGAMITYLSDDWDGYNYLTFSVFNPIEKPFKLYIRIDKDLPNELNGDRIYITPMIQPGENQLRFSFKQFRNRPIPKTPYNFKNISRINFFLNKPQSPALFYLDYLRLEK